MEADFNFDWNFSKDFFSSHAAVAFPKAMVTVIRSKQIFAGSTVILTPSLVLRSVTFCPLFPIIRPNERLYNSQFIGILEFSVNNFVSDPKLSRGTIFGKAAAIGKLSSKLGIDAVLLTWLSCVAYGITTYPCSSLPL